MATEPEFSRSIALFMIATSFGGALAIVWALGWKTVTIQTLAVMAGIAGATTASALSGIRLGSASNSEARLLVVLSLPLGFLAGAAALLVTVTILNADISSVALSGSALLGGIYGAIFGGYWAGAAESSALRRVLLSPGPDKINVPTAQSSRINWRGTVSASLSFKEGEVVTGNLAVWFDGHPSGIQSRPKARWLPVRRQRAPTANSLSPPPSDESSATTLPGSPDQKPVEADLVIEGGDDADFAEFLVTVSGNDDREAFPRRQLARVPVSGRSERYSFTLVRTERSHRERKDSEEIARVQTQTVILVDIAMAGRTLQVLELRVGNGQASNA